jgi:predicted nucleic acid binding AN1-type Zn finger protein
MKYLILFTLMGFATLSCKNSANNAAQPANTESTEVKAEEKSGPEYTSEYVCPMHCKGSGSDKAGQCPVCQMDYVLNEKTSHEGHDHAH